jgi:hypothetical protein
MNTSLSSRISQQVQAKSAPTSSKVNRAVFLVLREEIKQAMEDGWSVLAIWELLRHEGTVAFSYQTFRRYVNTLIRHQERPQKPGPAKVPPQEPAMANKKPQPTGIPGFSYRCMKPEDLI